MQPAPPAPPAPSPSAATAQPGGATDAVAVDVAPAAPALSGTALRARRAELSRQLNSADSRRQELTSQLRVAPPGSEAGLVARIEFLDQRIVQIEQDIAQNGQALASLPATSTAASEEDAAMGTLDNDQITAISIVFIILVLMPLAVAFGRAVWKRSSLPRPAAISPATEQRLERLEQGVDAIAVEVERISEGQRFVTRLLSEGRAPAAIGAPVAEREGVERHAG